ncbi:TFIIB-type zinc ribbon-containing protein [Candidatus Harpocratesius sp.]
MYPAGNNRRLIRYGENGHPTSILGLVFLIFIIFNILRNVNIWSILTIVTMIAVHSYIYRRNRSYISRSRCSSYMGSSNSNLSPLYEDEKLEKDIDLHQNASNNQINQDQLSENSSRFKRKKSTYEKSGHKEFFCGFCGNPVVVLEESSGEFYCPYCGEKNRL